MSAPESVSIDTGHGVVLGTLYRAETKAQAPAAGVIITHGFARDRLKHAGLAAALCRRLGVSVLTWDMLPLVALGAGRMRARQLNNVAALGRLRGWMHTTQGISSSRLGLVGFSAGGSVTIEAACTPL